MLFRAAPREISILFLSASSNPLLPEAKSNLSDLGKTCSLKYCRMHWKTETYFRAGSVTQWRSTCLARARPCVQSPTLLQKKRKKGKGKGKEKQSKQCLIYSFNFLKNLSVIFTVPTHICQYLLIFRTSSILLPTRLCGRQYLRHVTYFTKDQRLGRKFYYPFLPQLLSAPFCPTRYGPQVIICELCWKILLHSNDICVNTCHSVPSYPRPGLYTHCILIMNNHKRCVLTLQFECGYIAFCSVMYMKY